MSFWIILNGGLSVYVALIIIIKLHYYSERCHWVERVGMAMIACGMILNIGPIMAKDGFPFGENSPTPFDDWASAMLRLGLGIYFTTRCMIHFFSNAETKNKIRAMLRKADKLV